MGQYGAGNGQFNEPYGVAFDGAGHLVVVEFGNRRVQVLNYADGSHVHTIGSKSSGDGQFDSPYGGDTIDGDGRIPTTIAFKFCSDASSCRSYLAR